MTSPVRALWAAPAAAPAPPRRVWRDWALVAAIAVLAPLEALLRPEVPWRWLWAALLVALSATLLWRRVRPLAMLAIAFTIGTGFGLATAGEPQLYTTAYFLVLLYSLFRWGSGRAIVVGGLLVVTGILLSLVSSPAPADIIGGIAVAVATGTLGVAFRWRSRARARELDQARLAERMQLARDLHDTVAHHVSAIAIQAQAGALVAATDQQATIGVFQAIETEASRTLREMRAMVGVLRADAAVLAPTPSLGDLSSLATTAPPEVAVRVQGEADAVPAAVAATVFRIAQEAVTNARRHARDARRVAVDVRVDADAVLVEVRDDGVAAASAVPGFGIRGMQERAALLGGSCVAGPAAEGGWLVTASLPKAGWSA
ncbi:histidine kinase [Microbacterium sp. ProA8]|uniref:sensor histidine kinase n=1 Tax=Microbacterium chionoecetis TaxID=3153754 RepID=UPI003262F3D3